MFSFQQQQKNHKAYKKARKTPREEAIFGTNLSYNTDIGTDREFKINMINTLKALQEKVDNMHDQVGNVNKNGKKNHVAVL